MSPPLQPAIPEEELVARLQAKDSAALSILYKNYSANLYDVILPIVKCKETAEDALQETFIKAWVTSASYNSTKGMLRTWLLKIAHNEATDVAGTPHHRMSQEINQTRFTLKHTAHYSFKPEYIGVKALTDALKPEQKAVVDMMYFGGYSQSEVARELRIPLGTVKTRSRSAMQTLRRLYAPQARTLPLLGRAQPPGHFPMRRGNRGRQPPSTGPSGPGKEAERV